MSGAALRFKHTDVPRQTGERARLKVVQGPDQGAVYVVMAERITIGRGESSDVMISDLKTSRQHAELKAGLAEWIVKDLGSVNGILHNGQVTREARIRSGDNVTLGETTFEFVASTGAGTQVLVTPPREMAEVERQNQAAAVRQKRVRSIGDFGGLKALASGGGGGATSGSAANKRRLLIYGALGVAAFLAFQEPETPSGGGAPQAGRASQNTKKNEQTSDRALASYLPGAGETDVPEEVEKSAEQFYRSGFREYRQGNFLRAQRDFETVLQMDPDHRLARIYLQNCRNEIETQVKLHLTRGKRDYSAGKLQAAQGHYEAVLRLLFRNQSDPAFNEAKDQLESVKKTLSEVR